MTFNMVYDQKSCGNVQKHVPKYHLTYQLPFYIKFESKTLCTFYNDQFHVSWIMNLERGHYKFVLCKNNDDEIDISVDFSEYKKEL